MKRMILLFLTLAMIFSLFACGKQESAVPEEAAVTVPAASNTPTAGPSAETEAPPDSPLLQYLHDGIYVLDASEVAIPFDEVLLDLDLTERTFALKCFDGNVVTGPLEFVEEYMYCWLEDGCIAFHVLPYGQLNVCYPENVGQSYLMYCPQTAFHYAHTFHYAPERKDVLTPSGSDSFESRKRLAVEKFAFTCPVEGVEKTFCYVSLLHYGAGDTWELLRGSEYTPLEAAEGPDGSLVLSTDGQQWNFHFENNGLVFDGGSSLEAYGEMSEGTPKYTVALKPGDYFRPDSLHHLYDSFYVVSGEDGSQEAVLMLDTTYQRLLILCSDGSMLEAPYTYTAGGLYFPMGTHSSRLTFAGHSLYMSTPHNFTIVEGKDDFWFIPALDAQVPEKDFRFQIKVPEEQTVPQGSILIYEEYISVVSYPGMMLQGSLLLCSHDSTFEFNMEFCSFHVKGTYEEDGDSLTLVYPEGSTRLHHRHNALEVGEGNYLYLSGLPFTSVSRVRQELKEGTLLPRYKQGWLYDGTYTFTSEEGTSTFTFDTENRTFSMTDAYGREYEGDFTLDYKFVYCNAPGKSFQLIPLGTQIRLNQSEGEKVVPVENDYIFYAYEG